MIERRESPGRRRHRAQAGYTAAELLVTVAILGLVTALAAGGWQQYQRATSLATSAQTIKRMMNQARLRSIYQGVNFFVVLNVQQKSIALYEDTSLPTGAFDSGDALLLQEQLPNSVVLGFPEGVVSMPHPLGSGTVTEAWSLPDPGASTGLAPNSFGLMLTPNGQVMSTEDTATLIGFGAMVFNDAYAQNGVIGIGIEGRSGTVRAYRYNGSSWTDL